MTDEKKFITGRVKEINASERTLTAYASTGDVDRDNEIILPEAWRNSIQQLDQVALLWAHEYRVPPVGKASEFRIDGRGLVFTAKFAQTDFAEEIWGLYRDGFLDSFSVGFRARKWEDRDDSSGADRVFTEAELYEVSAVPVPANPHARVQRDAIPVISWKSIDNLPIGETPTDPEPPVSTETLIPQASQASEPDPATPATAPQGTPEPNNPAPPNDASKAALPGRLVASLSELTQALKENLR